MLGVMATRDAQRLAENRGLDLVEITPNAIPPVCKIMDYGKFKYEESIRAKQQRKAQKSTQVKEIKFHPGTDIGEDKIAEFLEMIKDECFVEQAPRTDGRIHSCLIGPPRKNGPKPQPQGQNLSGGIRISVS